jgi:hypothetical protein
MTVTQILSLARAKLLEQTTEIISDETLLIYADLVHKDLLKKVFTNNKVLSATVTFTSGSGTLPSLFGTLYGSAKDANDNVFEEVSIEDFDNRTLDQMVTIEGGTIKCYPTSTTALSIKYYPTAATLTVGATLAVDEYFHECMVYGIVARAFEDLQDQELSSFFQSKYNALLSEKMAVQSNFEEGNQRGGQLFTYTRLL